METAHEAVVARVAQFVGNETVSMAGRCAVMLVVMGAITGAGYVVERAA